MELYIIRHGETDWNIAKRLQGRSNVELNENGRKLARITSEALKDLHFDKIYSSPLIRAYETAQIMRNTRDIEIEKDDRLMEISFGIDEGVESNRVSDNFKNFFAHPELYTPPEGGETYESILSRTSSFLNEVIYPEATKYERVMIVAHGALNKALIVNLCDLEIKNMWDGEFQKNCCVNIFDISNTNIRTIELAKIYY